VTLAKRFEAEATLTASVELAGADWRLKTRLTVPAERTTLLPLLPMVQALTDEVVRVAVQSAEEKGQRISCAKGCGACCRQVVPITEVEARGLAAIVEELPEPRRSIIRSRFSDARRLLEESGLLGRLESDAPLTKEETTALGLDYFHLGIACPFLEEESCTIHHDRPIACREYLVTSPAEHCAVPSAEKVRCLSLPLKVSNALSRLEQPLSRGATAGRVPLVLALEWAAAHKSVPQIRPGPAWVEQLMENLTGRTVPSPDAVSAT
jgi:Fe-S-cluster containining protein